MQISDLPVYFQNLSDKKRQIIIGSSSVLAGAALLIGHFTSGPNALSYAKAEAAVAQWEESPLDESFYQSMREAIRQVPALGDKYQASIAQTLLNSERLNDALIFANRSLERVKDDIPFHATFAKTTFLIEEGKFQQALEEAVALKEAMGVSYLSEYKGGSLLYAYNLLRIACLQQELKNKIGEKVAWEDVEQFLQVKTPISEQILSSFSEKQIDLIQYITERKKAL